MDDPVEHSGKRTFIADIWPEFCRPQATGAPVPLAELLHLNALRRLQRRCGRHREDKS